MTHVARVPGVLAAAFAVIAACVVAAVVIYRGARSDAPTSSPAAPTVTAQRTTTPAPVHAETTTPALPRTRWSWPVEKLMQAIDGTRLRVDGRSLAIDSATALCSGLGSPVVRSGVRRWRAFDCTYTTFKGGIDRDVEFRVAVAGPNGYSVLSSDWIGTER
jgi:hypothetical protein